MQVIRKMWRVKQEHDVIRIFYYTRGWQQVRLRRRMCCLWMQYRQMITCQFLGAHVCIHVLVEVHVRVLSDIGVHDCLFVGLLFPLPMPMPIPSGPPLWPTVNHHPLCLPPGHDAHDGEVSLSSCATFERTWHPTCCLHLTLVRGSANSVCLHARHYLHHVPRRPHTWIPTHPTPFYATTLLSHLPPAHTPAPHSHLYFGYKLPVWHMPLGLASVAYKNRATLHIHSTHSINPPDTQPTHPLVMCT